MALGAAPHDIRRMVLGRAVTSAAVGIAIGLSAAWFVSRLLTTLLYDVEPNDASVLAVIALVLFVAAIVASYVPASRAAHVDPVVSLRGD